MLLSSCGGAPRRGGLDGPPPDAVRVDLSRIPDAVPRVEPPCLGCLRPYTVQGRHFTPLPSAEGYVARGVASWYGSKFHGLNTATGERYDMYAMTAAHPTLPLPCYAQVTNLANGRRVVVKINDRGPFRRDRLLDLSYVAAAKLGIVGSGSAPVEVRVLAPGSAGTVTGADVPPSVGDKMMQAQAPDDATGDGAPTGAGSLVRENPAGERLVYVQAGVFARSDNAQALASRISAAGLGPVQVERAQRSDLHRVRVGPVPASAADGILFRLSEWGVAGRLLAN